MVPYMSKIMNNNCQCCCGSTKFAISAPAITRAYCHCTVCQKFNDAPFADVVIYRKRDISLEDETKIEFNTYKAPPALQRGKCKSCGKPAIEFLNIPLFPGLVVVPVEVIGEDVKIPEPSCHLFYNQRHQNHIDGLPQHSGFLTSQLGLIYHIVKQLLFIK
jgi:hypothetical protein